MSNPILLNNTTPAIKHLCKKDKLLAKVISMVGNIIFRPLTDGDEYSYLIHAIINQMLSIKAGVKIYGQIESMCSGGITPEKITSLTTEKIRSTGTSNAKT